MAVRFKALMQLQGQNEPGKLGLQPSSGDKNQAWALSIELPAELIEAILELMILRNKN